MKTTTKVKNIGYSHSTVSITKEYTLTPEHFKVLDILILDDRPDIYRGSRRSKKQIDARYKAIIELGKMNILGSYFDGERERMSHFLTEYGREVARKIISAKF